MLYKFSRSMEASFLFALSALTEWRGLMTLMSSSLTTQRHTNPSMVLFCVCIYFIRTNIDIQELTSRLQRTFFCILVITALYLVPLKNETIIYPIALYIHHKVIISFILNSSIDYYSIQLLRISKIF